LSRREAALRFELPKGRPPRFVSAGDPVKEGYVASLNRPGGNLTGITWFGTLLSGKGFGLLHELVPNATVIALLVNPNTPESVHTPQDLVDITRTLACELFVLHASSRSEIDTAFATLRQRRADALLVSGDPFFSSRQQQIVALAGRDAIPTMYFNREFVADGGLMSYGNDIVDAYRRASLHVGRILKGDKPAQLPVDQATKFEFVINVTTAKILGLEVPATLLARADEVIE
jgi:ABC-type uncharacterized transport system substrate-binding protein